MLRVRAFLTGGPTTLVNTDVAKSILQCSRILSSCFVAHSTLALLETPSLFVFRIPINAIGLTGLSYDSLIRPLLCLCPSILSQSPAIQLENRLAQFEVIVTLAHKYRTDAFVRAFTALGCFAHSATLFRDLRSSPDYQIKQDTEYKDIACYNLCILAWRTVLQGMPLDKCDATFTAEVLNVNILFLVEWWSFHALDERLGGCSQSHCVLCAAFIEGVMGLNMTTYLHRIPR